MNQRTQHLRTAPRSTELARELRKDSATPERVLWGVLRNRRLGGIKFRRQVACHPYVVDFCCANNKLVVGLDGQSHDGQQVKDAERTKHLESLGLRIIRVTNHELATNPEGVGRFILSHAVGDSTPDPHPSPLPKREREPRPQKD
ncbi:MAG: endonuclease domain-containing protein [Phycisphaeraceae bacterium]